MVEAFIGVMFAVGFYCISNSLLRPSVSSLISKWTTGGQGEAKGFKEAFVSERIVDSPIL